MSDPAAEVFTALSDPTRRVLLARLAEMESSTATELAADLPISRQAVAKHLATLRHAQLVRVTRAGREARYRLTPSPLQDAIGWMTAIGGAWDHRLERLRAHLEGEGERSEPGGWGSEGEGERSEPGGWGSEGEGERSEPGGWGSEGEGGRVRPGSAG